MFAVRAVGLMLRGSLVALAALLPSTGCVDETLTLPSAPAPVAPPIAPPIAPPPAFPPLSRSGQIYKGPDSLYDLFAKQHGSSLASRYVLYDGSTFGLQFSSLKYPFFEYLGHYSSVGSVLTFTLDADVSWGATGTLRGDSLIVKYNVWAMWADFMDGVYVRSLGQ